jgi:hypothetical protein
MWQVFWFIGCCSLCDPILGLLYAPVIRDNGVYQEHILQRRSFSVYLSACETGY